MIMVFNSEKARKKVMSELIKTRSEEKLAELVRNKGGRPSIPEEEKRERQFVKVYLNSTEMKEFKEFVADRSASDVLRNMIRKMILEKVK